MDVKIQRKNKLQFTLMIIFSSNILNFEEKQTISTLQKNKTQKKFTKKQNIHQKF